MQDKPVFQIPLKPYRDIIMVAVFKYRCRQGAYTTIWGFSEILLSRKRNL
ncbi:MAG: hypothetical protein WBA16_07510 [Nonlabens sp.]